MVHPSFAFLKRSAAPGTWCADRLSMNPRARVFKYYWWVFWEGSPCEGNQFYSKQYRLCTAEAFALMARLREEGKPHIMLRRQQLPRWDPAHSPLRKDMKKWKDEEWALAWDDDPDPEWRGHK